MRVTHFSRIDLESKRAEALPFTEAHFKEANTLVTPLVGMHEQTALQLINKWNRQSTLFNLRFVYYV